MSNGRLSKLVQTIPAALFYAAGWIAGTIRRGGSWAWAAINVGYTEAIDRGKFDGFPK